MKATLVLSLYLLLVLINEIASQIYNIDEPAGTDYYCTAGASSCNITVTGNCNADICLGSSYHCPTSENCDTCQIDCQDTKICKQSTFYSYQCKYVKVMATTNAVNIMQEMTIYGPQGGNLDIYIHSREWTFYDTTIYSNKTNNINIDISRMQGDHVGGAMYIDASDATGILSMTCQADCESAIIKCPTNDLTNNCDIDCSNAQGNFKCKQMDIYTPVGWSSVDYSCDTSSIGCSGSVVYCSDDSTVACSMTYSNGNWDCAGSGDNIYCGGTPATDTSTDTGSDTGSNTDTNTNTNGGSGNNNNGNGGSTDTGGGSTPNEEEENEVNENGSSSWIEDNMAIFLVISISSILFLFFLLFCCIYLCKHEEKWLWMWDWISHACCKRKHHTAEIPGVFPTQRMSHVGIATASSESHHISPIPKHTYNDTAGDGEITFALSDRDSNIRVAP